MFNRLVNELYQDPILFTGFENITDRLLFDCGYIFSLPLRDIQKVSSAFISHTHFDHFMGFDHLLRMCIEQDRTIELYGPAGFIEQTAGKLSGYSWNLAEELCLDFIVREYKPPIYEEVLLRGCEGYKIPKVKKTLPLEPYLKKTEHYAVQTAVLDHKIPSLAFSVTESDFLKVKKEALTELGLKGGPWLGDLREEFLNDSFDQSDLTDIPGFGFLSKKLLTDKLFEIKKGKKVSYIVDTLFSDEVKYKALELIKDSDEFYCECSFMEEDSDKAKIHHHLTAKQAGILAREGNVKTLVPIHLSKRYNNRYWEVIKEVQSEFSNLLLPEKYRNASERQFI